MINLKGIGNKILVDGKTILITTGGVLLARKFLDFNVIFKNTPEDGILRKHQGAIKLLVALGASGYVKNPMLKNLLNGVAIEGGIRAIRQYGGGTFFEQIGDEITGNEDQFLTGLLEGLSEAERNELLGDDDMGSVTDEYGSGVAAPITADAWSGVSGVADPPGYIEPY